MSMRRLLLGLLVMVLVAPACDSGEVEQLREELDAARSEVVVAEKAMEASDEAAQDSERDRKSIARQLSNLQKQLGQVETPGRGVVVSIPLLGELTWKCNDDRDFSFTFTPDGATITVGQAIDGEITRRQLDPGEELTSGFLPPDTHREWTVTYRHKPGTISAGISVVPAVHIGSCFIRNSTLEQNRRPN